MFISIHALVKRATNFVNHFFKVVQNFNPRPREEGDEIFYKSKFYLYNFNPRPREEGDGNATL